MNQAELIKAVAGAAAAKATDVDNVLKALAAVTQEQMGAGGEVSLPGIGKFSVAARAARTGNLRGAACCGGGLVGADAGHMTGLGV